MPTPRSLLAPMHISRPPRTATTTRNPRPHSWVKLFLSLNSWNWVIWPCGLVNRLKLNPRQRTNYGHHSGSILGSAARDLSPHSSLRMLWLNSNSDFNSNSNWDWNSDWMLNKCCHVMLLNVGPKWWQHFESVKGFGSWKWLEVNLLRSPNGMADRCEK